MTLVMATPEQRSAPHQSDAERAVLGAVLRDNHQMDNLVDVLSPDDFYVGIHRRMFAAMQELNRRGEPIDTVTLVEAIDRDALDEAGGVGYITDLFDMTLPGTDPMYYAGIVAEKSRRRQLVHIATEVAGRAYDPDEPVDELVGETERRLIELTESSDTRPYHNIADLAAEAVKTIESRWNKELVGLDTGFTDLNEKTGGLHPNELIIIAARPGMGKTSFALNVAMNAASLSKKGVLFFSLEMGAEQLVQRLLSSESGIDQQKLRKGIFSRQEWPAIIDAAGRLGQIPLFINDTPALTVPKIFASARRLIADLRRNEAVDGLGLIVVDYLQLMSAGRKVDRRDLEVGEISRGLKLLAKDLQIPVIALSQLNRSLESRSDKRPMLSDLRESGAIEQDADVIMFIYRDDVYHEDSDRPNVAEIIIGKQRNGPLGTVELRFTPEFTRFDNLDRIHDVPGGTPGGYPSAIEPLP
ncbi:MAG: replicative DNA helicase [Candidatus Dadabacteria bacterium]|nr:MAG: replicative DNA helicase [Candidatus Dadabacteria bacterium]